MSGISTLSYLIGFLSDRNVFLDGIQSNSDFLNFLGYVAKAARIWVCGWGLRICWLLGLIIARICFEKIVVRIQVRLRGLAKLLICWELEFTYLSDVYVSMPCTVATRLITRFLHSETMNFCSKLSDFDNCPRIWN